MKNILHKNFPNIYATSLICLKVQISIAFFQKKIQNCSGIQKEPFCQPLIKCIHSLEFWRLNLSQLQEIFRENKKSALLRIKIHCEFDWLISLDSFFPTRRIHIFWWYPQTTIMNMMLINFAFQLLYIFFATFYGQKKIRELMRSRNLLSDSMTRKCEKAKDKVPNSNG